MGLDAHVVRRVHDGLTIDVSIRLGVEIGIVFGPSGAGKSSVLRLIAGLDRPAIRVRADRRGNPLRFGVGGERAASHPADRPDFPG